MQMQIIDTTCCPSCHAPNDYSMEKARAKEVEPQRCWSTDTEFTPEVLDFLPKDARGKSAFAVSALIVLAHQKIERLVSKNLLMRCDVNLKRG